jgi:hypothetical protein
MSFFNIFNRFKSKKQQDIPFDELHDFEEVLPIEVLPIEELPIEELAPTPEEGPIIEETQLQDPIQEEVVEEPVENPLDEIPELPNEDNKWIPMGEVMDNLKSKLKSGYEKYDLTSFLDFDYEKEGQMDGYHIHSSEFLKKKKQHLISEFQRLIEKRVDELKDERLNCKNLVIDMKGLSDQLVEKFQLRIELCNEYIEDLHNEKSLSNSATGLIRSVLTDYEVGWDKGMSDYLTDHYFLNPLKRL